MTKPPPMQSGNLPINQLPYGFKKRVADLTPIDDLHKLRQTGPEFEKLCRHRPELHDKLYITDSEIVYQWATKKLFVYRIFNIVFWLFRWLFDDESFNPTWHSVLYVDDIVKNRRPIFIKDTLVVHCQSIRAFEKLIPFICGSFTRLTIHGHVIKLNQLRTLMKVSRLRVSEMSRSTTLPGVIIRAYFARRRRLDRENEAEAIRSRNEAAMAAATNTATASARSAESTSTAVERPASNYYGYEEEEEFGVNLVSDGDRLDNHPSTWSRRGSIEGDEEDDAEYSTLNPRPSLSQNSNELQLVPPCPPAGKEVRDQLYTTDNKKVYEWASKKTLVFRIFKLVYWAYRWAYDAFGLNPTWHSVMYVDDIVKDNKLINVTDTLVLHIDTISSFEKLIPFICGPFTRLTIHGGDIKLDQLKRLMRDTVRKVEITAQIQLKPDEYDDAVRLITEHVRGFRYVFNLKSTPQLITKLKPIIESSRYLHAQNPTPDDCNVIHWKARWLDMLILQCQIGLLVFLAGYWIGISIGRKDTPMIQVLYHQNTVDSSSEGVVFMALLIY